MKVSVGDKMRVMVRVGVRARVRARIRSRARVRVSHHLLLRLGEAAHESVELGHERQRVNQRHAQQRWGCSAQAQARAQARQQRHAEEEAEGSGWGGDGSEG